MFQQLLEKEHNPGGRMKAWLHDLLLNDFDRDKRTWWVFAGLVPKWIWTSKNINTDISLIRYFLKILTMDAPWFVRYGMIFDITFACSVSDTSLPDRNKLNINTLLSQCVHIKQWNVITHPCSNSNRGLAESHWNMTWIGNYISCKITHVII